MRHTARSGSDLCICKLMSNAELGGWCMGFSLKETLRGPSVLGSHSIRSLVGISACVILAKTLNFSGPQSHP